MVAHSVVPDDAAVLMVVDHTVVLAVAAVRIVVEAVVVDHTVEEVAHKLGLVVAGHTVVRACAVYEVDHRRAWVHQSVS